ncbi:MAG: cytochrome c oxidase assembly protein [Bryobacteraceae bacterium]|jgi:cytochrome c oxidase assembly factor CtaG
MRTVIWFAASALTVAAVFASPLELFATVYLASAHVVKHLLLNLVAPFFLVLGLPPSVAGRLRVPAAVAWIAGALSLGAWYVPSLYNAALRDPRVEALQAASWVLGGVLLYLPLYSPARQTRLKPVPPAVIYLFAMAVVASVLGLRLATMQPGPYGSYLAPKDPLHILEALQNGYHLTPEDDQQTAGFLFWIGSCMVFLWSVMIMFYRMYTADRDTAN